jgi:transposase
MSRTARIKLYLTSEEILLKIKGTVGFSRVQKWLIIYNALNYPRSAKEIVAHLAVSESLVHKTIFEYNKYGIASIETKGKGGRRNSYLSKEEEELFVNGYLEKAREGQIMPAMEIKEDFEKKIEKKVNKTTIYRMLNWRKFVI